MCIPCRYLVCFSGFACWPPAHSLLQEGGPAPSAAHWVSTATSTTCEGKRENPPFFLSLFGFNVPYAKVWWEWRCVCKRSGEKAEHDNELHGLVPTAKMGRCRAGFTRSFHIPEAKKRAKTNLHGQVWCVCVSPPWYWKISSTLNKTKVFNLPRGFGPCDLVSCHWDQILPAPILLLISFFSKCIW